MTAKPTPFAPQVASLLSPVARRVLLSLATRSAVRTVPAGAIAPMTRKTWATVTADQRRAHIERLALRIVAELGPELASDKVLQYVAATHGDKVDLRTSHIAPNPEPNLEPKPEWEPEPMVDAAPSAEATSGRTAEVQSPYYLPCAYGCGRSKWTGSPLAQRWQCGNHRPRRWRRPTAEDQD